ncbi:PfkB family carbohydrate kinase [Streptomyces stramineus]
MNTDLPGLLDKVAGLRVLVVGDVILDTYLRGVTSGLCRESPVPAVGLTSHLHQCGAAANVAVNLRALGAEPVLLSVTGDDPAGRRCAPRCAPRAWTPARWPPTPPGRP